MLVELPSQCALPKVTVPREETASSCLSLEEEIDQFQLKKEEVVRVNPMEIPDSECEFDRSSATCSLKLIIVKVDSSSKKEDLMALNLRKGLRDLMAGQNKGSSSKEAPKSQLPLTLPPPLPPPTTIVGLFPNPNLKKKSKEQEVEKGEVAP